MDKENALDMIRVARHPESHELQGYAEEQGDTIDNIDNEEDLLDDFDGWKERNDLFFDKVQDQNYWASLG
jgi:hypothetical protein